MSASRAVRSWPLRGRKPSKTNRPVGSPLMTRAVIAALGPGTVSTVWPAAAAARTSRSPGSEMPGVPASVTTATWRPASSSPSTRLTEAASFWSCTARRRLPAGMPAWLSNLRLWRVSSQAMTSAARNASTARGAKSPRLPIGVATRVNRPPAASEVSAGTGAVRRFVPTLPGCSEVMGL